jgi:hypothetical protein
MDIPEFLLHYERFDNKFCPQATVQDVERKLLEEMGELKTCLVSFPGQPNEETIGELLDVMNVSIKLLHRYGVRDPLWAGVMKLEKTAAKYRSQGK